MLHIPNLPNNFTEIAVCSGSDDGLTAYQSVDTSGRAVQRFNRADGWNPQARQLCEAMLRAICARHAIKNSIFDIQAQSWVDRADCAPGSFRTGWVLLVAQSTAPEMVDQFRLDAHQIASLLRRPGGKVRPANRPRSETIQAASKSTIELELHFLNEPMLGARLKSPLDVEVSGYPMIRLAGVLSRRSARDFASVELLIDGARLEGAKLAGRSRHLSISGTDSATGESFREDRVRFEDRWRGLIAAAIERPSAPIVMRLKRETIDTGRASPRKQFKLVDLVVGGQLKTAA